MAPDPILEHKGYSFILLQLPGLHPQPLMRPFTCSGLTKASAVMSAELKGFPDKAQY